MKVLIFVVMLVFLPFSKSLGKAQEFFSGPDQVQLVELYSSEGCSSCPPADRWLAGLRKNKDLWKKVIPIEFHVDYWNQLGWVDPLSEKRFTKRQRAYASEWKSSTVYTPGFALNGKEWRVSQGFPTKPPKKAGQLKIKKLNKKDYILEFSSPAEDHKSLIGHVVLLGNGLVSKVPRGENAGRTLRHEFVVLNWQQMKMTKENKIFKAKISVPAPAKNRPASYSIVGWVQDRSSQSPIQAVGGDITL